MSAEESGPSKEWQALYEHLLDVLSTHGVNDAFGDGDFFLIDDDYGTQQHKIECTSVSVATPALLSAIQQALFSHPEGWEVVVALPSKTTEGHAYVVNRQGSVEHGA